MPRHPSLTARPDRPPPFRPRETMGAYEECWCGSEKKYRWCHHRRSEQPKVEIFQIDAQLRALGERGYCSHPHAEPGVCTRIAKAHTVQRRGGLAAIAEDGHVLTVKPSMKGMMDEDGAPGPRRVGVGQASVFPGFCGAHDTEMFRRAEGADVELSAETAFLLGFRAIAYERFMKVRQLDSFAITREMDRGHSFWHQKMIQGRIHALEWGVRRGLRDVDRWKRDYDEAFLGGDTQSSSYLAVRFDRVLPFVGCGAFHAEFDLEGDTLQRLSRGHFDFEHVAWNATVFQGRTVLVLSSICEPDGPAERFMRSFRSLPDARKADAAIRIAFEMSDNLYFVPSWWEALPEWNRTLLETAIYSGSAYQERLPDCLVDKGTDFASGNVVEVASRLWGISFD